jgi:hypothetical protein
MEKQPKPYCFLPIVASDDDDDDAARYVPGTLFANRKKYYSKEQPTTDTVASTSCNTNNNDITAAATDSVDSKDKGNTQAWCLCGNCVQMPTNLELKCCCNERVDLKTIFPEIKDNNHCNDNNNRGQKATCCVMSWNSILTTHVLHPVTLQLLWFNDRRYKGYAGDQLLFNNMTNKSYRFHAYRNYISFVHGHLGRGNRKVIPACVVAYIRSQWPEPDGNYRGFTSVTEEEDDHVQAYPDEMDGLE